MKKNFIIIWRNLLRNKTTSIINVFGLALGVGVFLAFLRIIQFEYEANSKIPQNERIYRIYSETNSSSTRGISNPASDLIKGSVSGLSAVSHFHNMFSGVIIPNSRQRNFGIQKKIIIADADYFEVFGHYEWLAGSKTNSLSEPYKVVLESQQAEKYFGHRDWERIIGKEIIYKDSISFFVSGVVKQNDIVTDLSFTDFISFSTIKNSPLQERFGSNNWGTYSSSQLWVKLNEHTKKSNVLLQLEDVAKLASKEVNDPEWGISYLLQPLSDLHFNHQLNIFDYSRSPAHIPTLTNIGIIACAILLMAIFNFVNLETAHMSHKSKEVRIKKILGSSRKELIIRFLLEGIVITLIAVLLAVPLIHYGLEYFEEYLPQKINVEYNNPLFWSGLVAIAIIIGSIASIYPSLVASASNPNSNSIIFGNGSTRKLLIFFQFLFSHLLIFCAIIISFQTTFLLDKELGFRHEGIVFFHTPYKEAYKKQSLLINQIKKLPEVSNYTLFNTSPVDGFSSNYIKFQSREFEVYQKTGDTTFINFFDIELLAGRNLNPTRNLNEVLINKKFSEELGFANSQESLGHSFEFNNSSYTIVGVIENFNFRSLHHPIEPMFYSYQKNSTGIALFVDNSYNMMSVINMLKHSWAQLYPNSSLNLYYMDENIDNFYQEERRTSKMISSATVVAIVISCLGLFGLVSFTIVRKTKELGIRKVLGASFLQISTILSKEFIYLLGIAFVISTPISNYFINGWMDEFAYQIEISWWIYLFGGILSLMIALFTIGSKVWRASHSNPVDSLRYE